MTKRNVVLVTVDSLRADRCGFMGYGENVTPTLDDLAGDGLVFENAIAPATTTQGSVPAFHTGQHLIGRENYSRELTNAEWCRNHMAARRTLAERLSALGYETGAFTANPWTSRHFGFDTGFDHFEDFITGGEEDGTTNGGVLRLPTSLSKALDWWKGQDMFMTWESLYDDILAWVEGAVEPYFLWVFLVDVHVPYIPPAAYRTESLFSTYWSNLQLYAGRHPEPGSRTYETLLQCYDDTIRYVDSFVDRLLGDLLTDDPLLFFHADHGEEFSEHGYFGHRNVYEGCIHVPMLVANGPSARVNRPFSLLRLPDLIESLARDNGFNQLTAPYATSRNYDPQFAVRGEDWKYVRWQNDEELFSVADGKEKPIRHQELSSIGSDIVDSWRATDREMVQIQEAIADVNLS